MSQGDCVVYLIVAHLRTAAVFVVDAIAQRHVEIALQIVHVVERVALGIELHKDILNAVLQQFAVGAEAGTKGKQVINVPVVKRRKINHD